ncbi:MAG TPA: MFS transporter [Candidatus Acidoferrales bacterium]|nr:MFS transporter [Candidatus Acidoferrales bacterium]
MNRDSTATRPPLTLSANIFYGVGSIAFGVHLTMLTSALMLFYNQVVGLPAAWVGAVMAATLIFDAICDPLIGEWSDHTRSRWGRRHPFMYASAVPAAIAFYFLFAPSLGWSKGHLLIYMAAMLVTVRVLLSLYEIPSSALGPELTLDYDQRTSLMSSRFFFGTVGAAGMSVLALQVFLRKDATHPLGLLNRAGYSEAAIAASIAIFLSIMISCVGTHRFIAGVVHAPRVRGTWREKFREVSGTITNRSFLALTISGIVGAISTGIRQGLDFYISAYFFELTPAQMSYLAIAALFAAFAGVGLAPAIARRFGKKPTMIGVFFASLFAGITPITMRLLGLLPPNGTAALFAIVLIFAFIAATLGLTGFIIVSSMMADVVEDAAVSTGQRSEGLLFAANGLISKCVTGVGTFFSGLILAWVSFPQHATPSQVDPAILRHLGLVYVPIVGTFSALAIAVLMLYDIDRSTHQRNVERLSGTDEADSSPSAQVEAVNEQQSGVRATS